MRRNRTRSVLFIVLLLAMAAACGSEEQPEAQPPAGGTATRDAGGGAAPDPTGTQDAAAAADDDGAVALDAVYAEVEGVTGSERRDALISLAQEEDGEFTVYDASNVDITQPIYDAFSDATDIDVAVYRASAEGIRARLLEESQAGFTGGADVVSMNGAEMAVLDQENLLLPIDTPVAVEMMYKGGADTWLMSHLSVYTAAWNTDAIPESEVPATWEDLLSNYGDGLVLESTDFDWFATLVTEYFMAEQGMTEDEAVELFRSAASAATAARGHTLITQLLAAGEYDIAGSSYRYITRQMAAEGAPVAWEGPEGPVEPYIVLPSGSGIYRDGDQPATALLFIEFLLSDGQQILSDIGRTPAHPNIEGALGPEDEFVVVDPAILLDDRAKWEDLYEEIVRDVPQAQG